MADSVTRPIGARGRKRRDGARNRMARTIPYQAQALNSPAAAAAGSRMSGGLTDRAAPSRLSTRNVSAIQPTVRSGGLCRHHRPATGPWWISNAMPRATGTATKNGHDTDTTAMPNSSPAHGTSRTAALTVNTAVRRSSTGHDGIAMSRGQAARTRAASISVRKATSATASSARPSQDRWNTSSQRRSWNTPNGAGAVTWAAMPDAEPSPVAHRMTVSTTGPPIAATINHRRRKKSTGGTAPSE